MKIINLILLIFYIPSAVLDENNDNAITSELEEQLYVKLFKRRRAEQLEAIKNFRKVTNYERQYSLIMMMAEKVFNVILESRAIIEASSYIPGVSSFPQEEDIREALSNILENTALYSEIILRFPDISIAVLKTNNNWDVLLQWSIAFANQVQYLIDSSTVRLLHLVSQELNHTERDPNYVNPYRKQAEKKAALDEVKATKKKKKKKEIKRGPRFTSHFEL